jgi:hypothetical protein
MSHYIILSFPHTSPLTRSLPQCLAQFKSHAVKMQTWLETQTEYGCYRKWYIDMDNNLQTCEKYSSNRFYSSHKVNMQKRHVLTVAITENYGPLTVLYRSWSGTEFGNWYFHGAHYGETDPTFTLLSTEAWCELIGFINSQNNRFPVLIPKISLHNDKHMWCAPNETRITGPIFSETLNACQCVTLHSNNIFEQLSDEVS